MGRARRDAALGVLLAGVLAGCDVWVEATSGRPAPRTARAAAPPAAEPAGLCSQSETSVQIVLVPSARRLAEAQRSLGTGRVVARASDTLVYADGRVLTTNLESVGPQLSALGWSHRSIEIVGPASAGRRRRPG